MLKRILAYFSLDIWQIKREHLSGKNAFFLQCSRVLSLTTMFFLKNQCALRASALTFFTLLSIVPVVALIFGIAKGYGFEEILKGKLRESMVGQEAVAERIIQFAESALQNASGGIVAGVGVCILIWTALKLLGNIEGSFNAIWGIPKGRTFLRRISDYLTMLIICPLMLIIVATSSAFLVAQLGGLAAKLPFSEATTQLILLASKLLPLFVAWLTFTFIYIFIPNTRVKVWVAFVAGVFTGSLYLVVQYVYMYLQTMLTSYNAIYGSFAAFPFFLVWLQASWLLILLGAQFAFALQNVQIYELEPGDVAYSSHYENVAALRIMQRLCHAFLTHQGGCRIESLSISLEIPIRTTRRILDKLCKCGFVSQLQSDKNEEDIFQLAMPADEVTPIFILKTMNDYGSEGYQTADSEKFEKLYAEFWTADGRKNICQPLKDME